MKKICVLLTKDYVSDSRVKKECKSLSKRYMVDLFCLVSKKSSIIKENKNWNVFYLQRSPNKILYNRLTKYLYYDNKLYSFVLRQNKKYDLIWANDVDTLKIGYKLKKKFNAKLIYDSHEYWRGTLAKAEKNYHYVKLFNDLYLRHEKKYIKNVDMIFTVNEHISRLLSQHYNILPPKVLYNVPYFSDLNKVKKVKDSLVYVGVINNDFKKLESILRKKVNFYYYNKEKIDSSFYHYAGFVSEDKVPYELMKYQMGLVLHSSRRLNEIYAAPNKFFQYIQAGLPILVNKECIFMSEFVEKYKIGLCFNNISEITDRYTEIMNNYEEFQRNVLKIRKKFCWENEETKIFKIL